MGEAGSPVPTWGMRFLLTPEIQGRHLALLWVLSVNELAPTPGDSMSSVLSSPALLCPCRLMPMSSFMESIYLIFGLPLFPLSSLFCQHYCLSQRTLDCFSFAMSASCDVAA